MTIKTSAVACFIGMGLVSANATQQFGEPRPASYLLLDLNGDGVALSSLAAGALFDIDGNGKAVKTGWTKEGSDDAFLAVDLNGNGIVDPGELVGTRFSLPAGSPAMSGATVLGVHFQGITLSADGRPTGAIPAGAEVLDKTDAAYSQLRLWTDRNHNGVTEKGELRSLGEAGVLEIRTGFRRTNAKDEVGNTVLLSGTFLVERQGVPVQRTVVEVVPVR